MLTTFKIAKTPDMPAKVLEDFNRYANDIWAINIRPGSYISYKTTKATALHSEFPHLDNWLFSNGADYNEEVLIWCENLIIAY